MLLTYLRWKFCVGNCSYFNLAKIVIKNSYVAINTKNKSEWTALHTIAETGNIEIVKELERLNASISTVTDMGQTLLHNPAKTSFQEVCESFLKSSGDGAKDLVRMEDKDGYTAALLAAINDHLGLMRYIQDFDPEGPTGRLLHFTVDRDSGKLLETVLVVKLDLN